MNQPQLTSRREFLMFKVISLSKKSVLRDAVKARVGAEEDLAVGDAGDEGRGTDQIPLPKLFAGEVAAKDTGRTVPNNHARAVGDGSGRAVGVRSARRFHRGKPDRPHPNSFTCPAIKAAEVSLLSLVFRTGDEHAALRSDGAAVAGTRQRRLPADVFPRGPVEGRLVLLGDTVPCRAAKSRPIACQCISRHPQRRPAQKPQSTGSPIVCCSCNKGLYSTLFQSLPQS